MVFLSSGESELMALTGGACENRNERPMEQVVQMLTWDDCAVCGQLSSSEICEIARVRVDAPRGHEGPFYAGLGDGSWTTYLEATWQQSTSC